VASITVAPAPRKSEITRLIMLPEFLDIVQIN
jgi:hypothetical protein